MALFGKKQNEVLEIELFTEEPNERVFEFKKSLQERQICLMFCFMV